MSLENKEGQTTSELPADTNSTSADDTSQLSAPAEKQESSSRESTNDAGTNDKQIETSADAIMQALSLDDDGKQEPKKAVLQPDKQETQQEATKTDTKDESKQPSEEKQKDTAKDNELYTMPEGLKKSGQERFNKLVAGHREMSEKLASIEQERDTFREEGQGFRNAIDYSQASPEEFRELLDYSHYVKTGNFQGAMDILNKHRTALAQHLGTPIDGVNLLEGHDDLQQRVDNYELTIDDAVQIANARRHAETQKRAQEDTQRQNSEYQKREAEVNKAVAEVAALETHWRNTDPSYATKHQLVVQQVARICKLYPPHMWKQATQDFYEAIKLQSASNTPSPMTRSNNQPLRTNGAGGGKPEPRNSTEAVMGALGLGN